MHFYKYKRVFVLKILSELLFKNWKAKKFENHNEIFKINVFVPWAKRKPAPFSKSHGEFFAVWRRRRLAGPNFVSPPISRRQFVILFLWRFFFSFRHIDVSAPFLPLFVARGQKERRRIEFSPISVYYKPDQGAPDEFRIVSQHQMKELKLIMQTLNKMSFQIIDRL